MEGMDHPVITQPARMVTLYTLAVRQLKKWKEKNPPAYRLSSSRVFRNHAPKFPHPPTSWPHFAYSQNVAWGCLSILEECTQSWFSPQIKYIISKYQVDRDQLKDVEAIGCGLMRDILVCNYLLRTPSMLSSPTYQSNSAQVQI